MVTSQIIDPLKGKAILIGVQNRGERRDEPLSPFPSFLEFFRIYLRADPSLRKIMHTLIAESASYTEVARMGPKLRPPPSGDGQPQLGAEESLQQAKWAV